ncbi:hypothetical protein [Microvirga sesbaniae]|uniref:hypothetical protein n=1 Tax=Microvirga sesbaniae TaxID=681392 RepID=UPI0021C9F6A4|nr:hypothetical protein [Microvirga sp. HBU67692]
MPDMAIIAPKLSRLIPMLATDHDGEVIAAVRAIDRTLKSAGMDFHNLVEALCYRQPSSIPVSAAAPEPHPRSLLDIANWCRTHAAGRLTSTERKFVCDMVERLSQGRQISQKQENWLRNIYYWNCGDVP